MNKYVIRGEIFVIALAFTLVLTACFSPNTGDGDEETATFTISLGSNVGNSRVLTGYPPDIPAGSNPSNPSVTDLKFIVSFMTLSGTLVRTFTAEGDDLIEGTITVGNYSVLVEILDISDDSLYAAGSKSPVPIASGHNPIEISVAEVPIISTQPIGGTYSMGQAGVSLSVSAWISNTSLGTLSYQWYSNTINSTSGGTPFGAPGTVASPGTAETGTFYYYVAVTNTSTNGAVATVTSDFATVTVLPHPLSVWTAVTDPTVESAFPNVSNSAFTNINAIAYGNGILVAGGSSGTMIYSDDDGDTWNLVSDSGFGTNTINEIIFGNGTFIAVGQNGRVSYSTNNGTTWTASTTSTFGSLYIQGIAYGNGRFVAGAFTNPNNIIAYSTDNGETWTAVTETVFGTTYMLRSMGFGNDRFIAAGNTIAYSNDEGLTWTRSVTDNPTGQISGIAYNNGHFVAGAYDASGNSLFYSNDNGDNWIVASGIDTIGNVYSVIYGNGYFVAAGSTGSIGYSSDGINWIAVPDVFTGGSYAGINGIVYTGNRFIAVGKGIAYCDF